MPYCALADIEASITARAVVELTDDAATGVYDTAKVDAAIADASALIDSYLAARYACPLATVPPIIKKLAVDLAAYGLHTRRMGFNLDDAIRTRYTDSIKILERIADGTVVLAIPTAEQAPAAARPVYAVIRGESALGRKNQGLMP